MRISAPYKFVSKEFRKGPHRIRVGESRDRRRRIRHDGGSVLGREREADHGNGGSRGRRTARKVLRGGAFKPRTSPYDFQGMEEEGLKLLAKGARSDRSRRSSPK